jgi:hypothetical protein
MIGLILIPIVSTQAQERIYKITTPLPKGRQMYGAVVLGDYLYIIGGVRNQEQGGYTTKVERSRINKDGTLAAWEETTPLPANRSYIDNTTITLNDIVYIVGGLEGISDQKEKTILWSRPRIDGHLEPWQTSQPYPGEGVSCSAAIATPGYIHLIGGSIGNRTPTDKVWSAQVGPDGTVLGWEPGTSLPVPLWYHCAGVAGGNVWIWGGLTESSPDSVNRVIYYASILSSGRIGNWQISDSQIPEGFYSSSCTVSGRYLLNFCPRYAGNVISNDIWFAYLNPEGALSGWTKLATDLPAKMYIGLASDYRRGFVYLLGGRLAQENYTLDNNVCAFRLAGREREEASTQTPSPGVPAQTETPTQPSYMQSAQMPVGRINGFLPYETARQLNKKQPKPLVLYFNSERARLCREQEENLKTFNMAPYQNKIVFAELNILNYPQLAQQYGIFRIPHWMFFDAGERIKFQKFGVIQARELGQYLDQLMP